jgi:uncharacterized damage-inducible protein DinB
VIAHILFEPVINRFEKDRREMHRLLNLLFQYKAWANEALLASLAELEDGSKILAPAIKALSHTYVVDRIFLAHLRGKEHDYHSANMDELPTLHDLGAGLRISDQQYLEMLWVTPEEALPEPIDFTFTDGLAGRMSREEMLMHVILHGAGHRGQISALMLMNAQQPAKDGFATFLHEVDAARRRAA